MGPQNRVAWNLFSFILNCRFEEGVRAQVSQEIDLLRQQQQSFSNSIDHLLDKNDMADDDEE